MLVPRRLDSKSEKKATMNAAPPNNLAKFVLSRELCTPFQLYGEVKRLMLDGVLTEDSVELVTEWFIAPSA